MKDKKRGYYEPGKRMEQTGIHAFVIAGRLLYNGLHWHDEVEIFYCKEGSTRLMIEGRPHELKAGDFVTIGSGRLHEIIGSEDSLQIICSIDPAVFEEGEGCEFDLSTIGTKDTEELQEVRRMLGELAVLLGEQSWARREGEAAISREERIRIRFRYLSLQYALLAILTGHRIENEKGTRRHRDTLRECVQYINEHLGEELSAGILAEQLHVSQPTVYRLFQEQIGMHLGEYITQVRVDAACRYLLETEERVIDIAYACGFSGLSNFYRVFRKYMSSSPADYRKANKRETRQLAVFEPDIMKLNRFLHFSQLGMEPERLLQ